ncbi:MAG: hypothetical protein B0D92_08720 [Spirochaeta sp. LUC14_002_19_P3]|nr:MAG: hypothetical protein B0D92_08720 [Spirochaeta sp. LUC14_002_19_P3]
MNIPLMNLADAYADYRGALMEELNAQIDECRFIGGTAVARFEAAWAAYCGLPWAAGCSNGTDALVLALEALGIGAGDEVFLPANSFIATAEAVCRVSAKPVFCDVEEATGLMDAAYFAEAVKKSGKPGAVIPVHLYGQMADIEAIVQIAAENGLKVIEDAAQAHGARRNGLGPGQISDAATFSFYPGKNLGAWGDAGAVVSRHEELLCKIKMIRDHGREKGGKYLHLILGHNHRMDAIQATVLCHKLLYLDAWAEKRRGLAQMYGEVLADIEGIARPITAAGSEPVWYVYTITAERRDELAAYLKDRGIATGIYYPLPLHRQPAFRDRGAMPFLPVTEDLAGKILSLPFWPEMTQDMVRAVGMAMREFYG